MERPDRATWPERPEITRWDTLTPDLTYDQLTKLAKTGRTFHVVRQRGEENGGDITLILTVLGPESDSSTIFRVRDQYSQVHWIETAEPIELMPAVAQRQPRP